MVEFQPESPELTWSTHVQDALFILYYFCGLALILYTSQATSSNGHKPHSYPFSLSTLCETLQLQPFYLSLINHTFPPPSRLWCRILEPYVQLFAFLSHLINALTFVSPSLLRILESVPPTQL